MSSELIDPPAVSPEVASGCPVVHASADAVCPFPHGAGSSHRQRSRADLVVRKVLRIKERPEGVSERAALKAFEKSMLISATRCTLTYIVFPFVLPAVSFIKNFGPVLGIIVGVVAMVCDVFTIRRFFAIDHKWRWYFAGAASCVIGLLTVLLVQDIVHVAIHGV